MQTQTQPRAQIKDQRTIEAKELGWLDMNDAHRDGTIIDVYFVANGNYVLSRTMWIKEQSRWNGMSYGQEPCGWKPTPKLPSKPLPVKA